MAAAGSRGGGGSASAVRMGRAFVEVFVSDAAFTAGLNGIKAKMLRWGASLSAMGGGLRGLLVGAGGAFGLGYLAKQAVDVGGQLQDMSERLGASVEELNALGYAARQSGGSLEDVEVGVSKLQQAIAAGKMLGDTNLGGLMGLPLPQQIDAVADAIKSLGNIELQQAAARELFGRSGKKLLQYLRDGAEGMARFRERAAKVTGVTGQLVGDLDEIGDALVDISLATAGVGMHAISALFGGSGNASTLAEAFVDFAQGAREFVRVNASLIQVVGIASMATLAFGALTVGLGAVISAGATVIGFLASYGVYILGAGAAIAALVVYIREFSNVGETFTKSWKGFTDAVKSGGLQLAFKIAFAGVKVEFFKLIQFMTNGVNGAIAIAMAELGGLARGGVAGGVAAGAAAMLSLGVARARANAGAEEAEKELNDLLAQVKQKNAAASSAIGGAAAGAMLLGGPTKGGFGTAQQIGQQFNIGDQAKIVNGIVGTEKNTKEIANAMKKAGPLVWAA